MNDSQAPDPSPDPPPTPLRGPAALPASPKAPVWGPWSTLALGSAVVLVFLFGQLLPVAAAFVRTSWWRPAGNPGKPALDEVAADGDVLGASSIAGGALAMLVIAALAFARGSTPARYLQLKGFPWRQLPLWLAATYAAGMVQTMLAPLFHHEAIPEFMVDIVTTADHPLVLILGIVVAAPLFEEWFFRGFLHEGWRRSRLGFFPAMLLTSAMWMSIHLQYGWFDRGWIFCFGLLLTLAREWSGSLWLPIAMHATNNGMSLIATALEVG